MKFKTIKKILAIAILTVLAGSVGAQSVSSAAVSTIPSPVPTLIGPQSGLFIYGYSEGPTGDASLNPILNSMNITLNTKLADLGMYLHGNQNSGNGLIELLMSINAKLSQQTAQGTDAVASADMAARVRLYQQGSIDDALQRGVALDGSTMRNIEQSCEDTTFAAGRGGAASGTSAVAAAQQEVISDMLNDNRTGINRSGRLYAQHTQTYCSKQDVDNKRPGCGSLGDLPGADVTMSSVFSGATKPGKVSNSSYDAKQQDAALAYVQTVAPFVPSDAPENTANTPGGREYTTALNRFRGRSDASVEPLVASLALRSRPDQLSAAMSKLTSTSKDSVANTANMTGYGYGVDGQSDWASVKPKYQQLFGSKVDFPAAPSEWEVLKYDVFSRYADAADADSWQAKVASFTEQQGIQELDRMAALQLRLMFLQTEQQQKTNALLGLILANQLDPLSSKQLQGQLQGVSGNSQ